MVHIKHLHTSPVVCVHVCVCFELTNCRRISTEVNPLLYVTGNYGKKTHTFKSDIKSVIRIKYLKFNLTWGFSFTFDLVG